MRRLVGMVFWWSSGKCIDGLLLARKAVALRLSWIHPILGIWELLAGGALYVLGLSFATQLPGDPPPDVLAGSGIVWILLGAVSIAGFWRQRAGKNRPSNVGVIE